MRVSNAKKSDPETSLLSIWNLVFDGRIQKALAECLALLNKHPKDYQLLLQTGEIYLKLGQQNEGIQCFRRAADLCHAAGHDKKAIALLQRVKRLDPTIEEIYFSLAAIYRSEGLKNEAKLQLWSLIEQHRKSKPLDAETVRGYFNLIELDPEDLRLRVETCQILETLGMLKQLREQYLEMSVYVDFFISKGRLTDAYMWLEWLIPAEPSNLEHTAQLSIVIQRLEEGQTIRVAS